MEITTRKAAKELGLKRYFTGKPCKQGHVHYRSTVNGSCLECANTSTREHRSTEEFKSKRRSIRGKYREVEKAYNKIYKKNYYETNRDKLLKSMKLYRDSNKERIRLYHKRYYLTQSGIARIFASNARRRASKSNSTPAWADAAKIQDIYLTARKLQDATGIMLSVDHYYPLRGKTVCGLHVHNNLQILTSLENSSKHNKHPDVWEKLKTRECLKFLSLEDITALAVSAKSS